MPRYASEEEAARIEREGHGDPLEAALARFRDGYVAGEIATVEELEAAIDEWAADRLATLSAWVT